MNRNRILLLLLFALVLLSNAKQIVAQTAMAMNYRNNLYPLQRKPYVELPIGSIKPSGWLKEMLVRQRNGMSSSLDILYPKVMGERNGWLGGDGDQWERGPYWIDGLLPLAYILDDDSLKQKIQPWIEWALASQREDGFFGPSCNYEPEEGLQRNNSEDWWPRMVVLKIMKQYYSATQDGRVLTFLSNYFRYQLHTLPHTPLGNWTFWAEYRACDNLQVVYWLYNITGESFLLDLGKLLHQQSYNYVDMFWHRDDLTRINTIHGVNLAQGIKEPVIYYQQDPDSLYICAVKKAFADIRKYHGQPQGMYGADEALHGNKPTQGAELCSIVELMYSLESMLEITGDIQFADHLEKLAFNALPTQISDDFMARQYFQQPNQVMLTRHMHNFDINHGETDIVFGLLSGYPCCTSNLHQGWPKFTQNLWYATADNGLAALVYAPSEATVSVADGIPVKVTERTHYPMNHTVSFDLEFPDVQVQSASFPFHLRIPSWCTQAEIRINGVLYRKVAGNTIEIIKREWKDGDSLELTLPMRVQTSEWYENSVAIERGPLVYALKIGEKWVKKLIKDNPTKYGDYYYEVLPTTQWNYGLVDFAGKPMEEVFTVIEHTDKMETEFPWSQENAPVEIKVKAKRIPSWQLYNEMAGPQPYSRMIYGMDNDGLPEEDITLIPYGCTTLRITEFPVLCRMQ
ncbi:beta-L-arabinofuranosidase domain-containing protein [Bacteroides oleiciplenus]|uniref:beta-L-arabinofuranosidase domain-containing protein n=1 Tax=Bacteroides oleiciplenus TaxID=626931 RepID=UPI0026DCED58|nr:beta-L-arabinofuranosidase domain-containing protein [Bacteroides oleiciplenus]